MPLRLEPGGRGAVCVMVTSTSGSATTGTVKTNGTCSQGCQKKEDDA